MFRPRIIPVLLLKNQGLVKSVSFKNHRYIGDPINAVKIFNDLNADELVILDILASKEKRSISCEFVKNVGEEANMPFAAGGGITTLKQIQLILASGAEKVVINTHAAKDPEFIRSASETFGSSTIVVCIDVKKRHFGKEQTWVMGGNKPTNLNPVEFAKLVEEKGAGEIIIQSIEQDGKMSGYDITLIRKISQAVVIPVVALGGAGNLCHMQQAYKEGFANGLAAASMFVYHGARNGILINYPDKGEISKSFIE
jgi:imidazole glycerol-phosphate synthase subunit HisF